MRLFTVLLLGFLFVSFGCRSNSDGKFEELSDGEKAMLIENARVIFLKYGKNQDMTLDERMKAAEFNKDKKNSKPKTHSFSPGEKSIVKNTNPNVKIIYSGDKEGKADISWRLSDIKTVKLIAAGRLLEKDKVWVLNVVNSEELVVTPEARKALERSGSTLIQDLKAGKSYSGGK